MIEAYPLQWPLNKPRTKPQIRKQSLFKSDGKKLTVYEAVNRIKNELDAYTKVGQPFRVKPESIVISTNIPVRKDGTPYSNFREPDDCGVAVYFTLDKRDYCLPCDKWDRVADNLAAVAAHLNALRGIERWGVGETHDVFTGFKALPEQTSGEAWHTVLGVDVNATQDEVKKAYHSLAAKYHPDKNNGDSHHFAIINNAYKQALQNF